jgi:L-ascorbate metabolism protein UlaG (beta-lactamase superfamily)
MAAPTRSDPLALTYLGAAGWHVQLGPHSLLIDPYFTRLSLWQVLAGRAIPRPHVIRTHTPLADWVLVTHPHVDHIMDVPEVACLTGAQVYASPQGCDLLNILGTPGSRVHSIRSGDSLALGPFAIEVHCTPHRVIYGRVPFQGALRPGLKPPLRARDYRIQEQFSFRIQAGGMAILVASGIDDEPAVPADVVLVGADASPEQLAHILGPARPGLILPNHWDDMFRPLDHPVRPMIRPTPRLTLPRRIDLDAWATACREIAPSAQVRVPERFVPCDIASLLRPG